MKFNTDISVPDLIILVGALGYFICPADVIPDAIPAIGFVDDAAALAAVFRILKKYVTTESGNATKRKLARIFRNTDEEELARIVESLTRKGEKV